MHPALAPHQFPLLDLAIRGLSHLLVPMFAVGMVGATVVVAITFFHDLIDFFSDEGEDALPTADTMTSR